MCLVLHVLRGGRHRSRACVVGGAEDPTWAVECDMVHNAQVLQGLVILTEHRFYGKSQPFTDLSTEHLQYLSSEQALADYANLIDHVRELYNATDSNPVVAFGGSYSGALAAWLRLKVGHPAVLLGACGHPLTVCGACGAVSFARCWLRCYQLPRVCTFPNAAAWLVSWQWCDMCA